MSTATVSPSTLETPPPVEQTIDWAAGQRIALYAAGGGALVAAVGALISVDQFFRSYLVAYNYWFSIGLGSMVVLMVQHLTGGVWGLVLRRPLEAATRTLPLLALLFVPILMGMNSLYPWFNQALLGPNPEREALEALAHKAPYLNFTWFTIRAVVYFTIWLTMAYFLNRWSTMQDQVDDPRFADYCGMLSGPGLAVYGLTITFASIDWIMSIEPLWYSTMYPVLYGTGQMLTGFAFGIAVLVYLAQYPPLVGKLQPSFLRDIGSLLLAFVMLWAYMSISQFLLVWSGNLPEEIPWYLRRLGNGWWWVGLALVLFHFTLPFLLLLSRDVADNPRALAVVALGLLVMRFIDLLWWIQPAFPHDGIGIFAEIGCRILDLAVLTALGGVWMVVFLWQLRRMPLLPVHDAGLKTLAVHHHG